MNAQPTLFTPEVADTGLRPLRERQGRAIAAIRQAVREGHKRIVVQAPTGFGKTLMAAHLIDGAIQKGTRPIFVCPAINLVNQTLAAFEYEGIRDIGVIQAQHERTDWCAQVQIASVQTLIRRALPEVDFVIQDEVHQIFDKFNKMLDGEAWKDKIVIGLSATPWARGMGKHWTKLIIAATTRELIDEGWLSPFRVYAPAVDADFGSIKVVKGEFDDTQSSAVMSEAKIVADVVQTWLDHAKDLPTFMFCVDRAHAKAMRDRFMEQDISCGYIDGESTAEERLEMFRRFRSGEDKIVASVGCLITGIDEDVRAIIDCQPTMSEMRHVQKIGRGLRTADGKSLLTILDHAGNTLRLGLVTDIHHEKLDNRKPSDKSDPFKGEKKTPKPKKCSKCFAIIPRLARICPHCQSPVIYTSDVQEREGTLVEYGSGQKPTMATLDKQAWYSGFLWIAHERGHSEGWSAYRFKEKFHEWPNGLRKEPCIPSSAVRSFDTHCRIKFHKSKQKAAPPPEVSF
jgi:superfamily II DNA or RNA helicase